MANAKRILIVCGTAIATSTVVAMKVEELLKKHGIRAEIRRCMTSEALTASKDVDLIVATTQVPAVDVPVISGIPFITGIGTDRVEKEIIDALQGKVKS
ncbi:MAG: PTS sugar transporter subunit IIB [Chloroflexi bacterium]|nr:PTS sugar transporter subunit IIB [Chloroflexota bacterium]